MNRFVIWEGGLKSHPFLRHRMFSEDVGQSARMRTAGKLARGKLGESYRQLYDSSIRAARRDSDGQEQQRVQDDLCSP